MAVVGDGIRYDDEFFAPGWGDGVAGLEGGPYDALMANDSRVLGDDASRRTTRTRRLPASSPSSSRRGASSWAARPSSGTAPADTVEMRLDRLGAAVGRGRRDARQQRQQHRRDGRQGTRSQRQPAPGTREAGLAVIRRATGRVGRRRRLRSCWPTGPDSASTTASPVPHSRRWCSATTAIRRSGRGFPVAGQTGTLSDGRSSITRSPDG